MTNGKVTKKVHKMRLCNALSRVDYSVSLREQDNQDAILVVDPRRIQKTSECYSLYR